MKKHGSLLALALFLTACSNARPGGSLDSASSVAAPVRTPWQSLNSRIDAPAGLQITLFQELLPAQERTAQPGFDTGH